MTSTEKLARYRDRIERFDGRVHAFLHTRFDEAEGEAAASARRAMEGRELSPIDGMVVAVKANIAVAGLPHHAGITSYGHVTAETDAEVVRRLKAAGAVIVGVVNMHEGALGATTDNEAFGRTHNPWRDGFTPGGSSGGSAAAVAADFCDAALGSDTMGSVRIPSAYCGVQGFKPSAGAVSNEGVIPLSHSLDHVGVHALRAATLAPLFEVISGRRLGAQGRASRGLRVGVWRPAPEVGLDADVLAGFESACRRLEGAGLELTEFDPPIYRYGPSRRAGLLVSEREAAAFHAERLAADPGGFSETFRKLLAWGAAQDDDVAGAAYAHIRDVRQAAAGAFAEVDAVLAPTAPQTAFSFEHPVPANQADLTAWANLAGLPAAAVYAGLSGDGLPLSLQLIGRRDADGAVLDLALKAEEILGPPPLPPGFA